MKDKKTRTPRSVRKHIRRRKAAFRKELSPEQAEKAIERLKRASRS